MKEFGSDIEMAVKFITAQFARKDTSGKPVLVHSFRVGMKLFEDKYPLPIVLAGFLHDVIEDSDAKANDIAKLFGTEVAELVKANSKDERIPEVLKRREELIKRVLNHSEAAAIVRTADILDNYEYYSKLGHKEGKKYCQYNSKLMLENLPKGYQDKIFTELHKSAA